MARLAMVLNDGETYTDLSGCKIVVIPDSITDEDEIEAYLEDATFESDRVAVHFLGIDLWDIDVFQFPRLLSEIRDWLSLDQEEGIAESMDLSVQEVEQLFERAMDAWEKIKAATT